MVDEDTYLNRLHESEAVVCPGARRLCARGLKIHNYADSLVVTYNLINLA